MGMLRYGIRNMLRNPLRILIVVFLTALPFFSVLMMASLQNGINAQITTMKKVLPTGFRLNRSDPLEPQTLRED